MQRPCESLGNEYYTVQLTGAHYSLSSTYIVMSRLVLWYIDQGQCHGVRPTISVMVRDHWKRVIMCDP